MLPFITKDYSLAEEDLNEIISMENLRDAIKRALSGRIFYSRRTQTNSCRKMVKENKAEKVAKTLGFDYNIQKKRSYFSLGFALIITLLILGVRHGDEISTTVNHAIFPPLNIKLTQHITNYDQEVLDSIAKVQKYVPNYDAEIYISLAQDRIGLDQYIQCRVIVRDKGIVRMQKPYFHVFFVDPTEDVFSSFPTVGHLSMWDRMLPWYMRDRYNNFYTDCLEIEIEDSDYYVPRDSLLEGYGKYVYTEDGGLRWSLFPSEIFLQLDVEDDPSLIGGWRIYVFVSDEKYFDRFGEEMDSYIINFVSFSIAEFQVSSKGLPSPDPLIKFSPEPITFLITSVLTYLGIYGHVEKHKDKLKRIWALIKEHRIFILSLVLIIVIQILLYQVT